MSSNHVSVAVHEFGGAGRPLLFSHATGFHGYCYLPIADHLDDRFTSYALDYRGHGSTPLDEGWSGDWERYGDDAVAAATAIAPDGGLIGFGHSMGATALLMAAHRNPGLFDLVIGFEPIVFPEPYETGRGPDDPPPIIENARRRRRSFDSFEQAIDNYASKPPFQFVDPDVLRLYVAHGFRSAPEGVRLVCDPEHEATTFVGGAQHRTWDVLPEIGTSVVVIGGGGADGPALVSEAISRELPNARYIHQPDSTHFGPLVDPAGTAALIAELAS